MVEFYQQTKNKGKFFDSRNPDNIQDYIVCKDKEIVFVEVKRKNENSFEKFICSRLLKSNKCTIWLKNINFLFAQREFNSKRDKILYICILINSHQSMKACIRQRIWP